MRHPEPDATCHVTRRGPSGPISTPFSLTGILLAVAALLSLQNTAYAALPAAVDGEPLPSLAPVLERITPAVINVHSSTTVRTRSPFANDPVFRRFFGLPDERVARSLGSGVIVDADRAIALTNNHVIDGADEIKVTLLDGTVLEAELIGADPDTDLAVIRLLEGENLAELALATDTPLRVGDFVVAVGNPFGLGQTVTSGIVSALGRKGLRGLNYQNFIQTDASINPGNSGGALINLRGDLVGINTAIFSPSGGNVGIGFAIPASIARYVIDELVDYGHVRRGRIGVVVQDLTPRLAEALGTRLPSGAVIARVLEESEAQAAGLTPGDVITAINGNLIANRGDFLNAEGLLEVGKPAEVDYWRDGELLTTTVAVFAVEPDRASGASLHPRLSGATMAELDRETAAETGLNGVLITEVRRGSVAARLGLRRGDLITGVNRTRIESLAQMRDALARSDRALLNLLRGRNAFLLPLE